MQEERANQDSSSYKAKEAFWKKHFAALKASDLSRSQYCTTEKINYDRFGYYISKWSRNNHAPVNARHRNTNAAQPLLPVRMKLPQSVPPLEEKVWCRLVLKNGCVLTIHHEQALSLILSRCLDQAASVI